MSISSQKFYGCKDLRYGLLVKGVISYVTILNFLKKNKDKAFTKKEIARKILDKAFDKYYKRYSFSISTALNYLKNEDKLIHKPPYYIYKKQKRSWEYDIKKTI